MSSLQLKFRLCVETRYMCYSYQYLNLGKVSSKSEKYSLNFNLSLKHINQAVIYNTLMRGDNNAKRSLVASSVESVTQFSEIPERKHPKFNDLKV